MPQYAPVKVGSLQRVIASLLLLASLVSVVPGRASGDSDIDGSAVFDFSPGDHPRYFTFTLQNDIFVNEDDDYTNGIGLTFARGPFLAFSDTNLPGWLNAITRRLYVRTMPDKVRGVAYMLFQRMQTPHDITSPVLQARDVPYAGLLALQSTLYAWDRNLSDQFSIYIGAVGPVALAEQSQTAIHSMIGSDRPRGWEHQLDNEPVVKLEAQRVWKLYRRYDDSGKGFDILGITGAGIGNLETATKIGIAMRWGSDLELTHATFQLQSDRQVNPLILSRKNNHYFYLGARGGVVLNDILIDGNTFSDSHSAPLEHFQNQISGGLVWKYGPLAYVFQLSEFSSRTTLTDRREKYGALSVTFRF